MRRYIWPMMCTIALVLCAPLILAQPSDLSATYLPSVFRAVPTPTPQLPPASYHNCKPDTNPNAAPNYPLKIVAINKITEVVILRNVSTHSVGLSNWRMCSVTGKQKHKINGTLTAGETRAFPNSGVPIWDDSSSDPGALYNQNGQLVSYYPD
jgi:endonuclease G, mitochondrial